MKIIWSKISFQYQFLQCRSVFHISGGLDFISFLRNAHLIVRWITITINIVQSIRKLFQNIYQRHNFFEKAKQKIMLYCMLQKDRE